MYNMRKASVREVQHHLSDILDAVERGDEFTVTRRGKIVARIVPARAPRRGVAWPDFEARMKQTFPSGPPAGLAVSAVVDELRGERT